MNIFLMPKLDILTPLRWRSRCDTVSCEVNAVHGVVVPYSHGRYQVCRMSSDTIRTNTVHLLSSKTCSTHLLFIDMQHIVRWKHGRRDRFCNSFRRYITGRRKFGIAEALQLKHFSLNGHLNNSIVRTMSECKHDEYGSRGKIGFPALEIFGLRLDWEVREIFIWCQQQRHKYRPISDEQTQ